MHFEFLAQSESSLSFIAFEDTSLDVQIGAAEGYIGKDQQLTMVVKVYNGFHQKGIGYFFFTKVFEHFSNFQPVNTINGSWSKDAEFSYCEDGESTNLKVFKSLVKSGYSMEEAALNTPTGKWARKLGYNQVKILSVSDENVNVSFTRLSI